MINIYICEDMPNHLQRISKQISYYISFSKWEMEIKYATNNPAELLKNISTDSLVNIYFLDIDLNCEMNGLALAAKIRAVDPFGYIIFITSRSEMSYLTFKYKVSALDFILKDSVDSWEDSINQCFEVIEERLEVSDHKQENTILLSTPLGEQKFVLDSIYVLASTKQHKIELFTKKQQTMIVNTSLTLLEKKLPEHFFRCHRGFIINLENLEKIETNFQTIYYPNQIIVPVSIRKKAELKQKVNKLNLINRK